MNEFWSGSLATAGGLSVLTTLGLVIRWLLSRGKDDSALIGTFAGDMRADLKALRAEVIELHNRASAAEKREAEITAKYAALTGHAPGDSGAVQAQRPIRLDGMLEKIDKATFRCEPRPRAKR